jgi:hypothetical protein
VATTDLAAGPYRLAVDSTGTSPPLSTSFQFKLRERP